MTRAVPAAIATDMTVILLPRSVSLNRRIQVLLPELVADAAHREEELGLLRVALELLAQVADVDVDRARIAVLGVPPDVLEQRLAAEHAAGAVGEGAEDLELDVGQLHLIAAQGHHAAAEVDRQLAAVDRTVRGQLADHARAPQHRLDAAAELAHREGLGD